MHRRSSQRRNGLAGRLPWLVAAGLVAEALLIPAVSPVAANTSIRRGRSSERWRYADDCKDVDLSAGQVLWHFVQTGTEVASGELTATFTTAGEVTVDSYKHSGKVLHWQIITGHDTLVSASSDIENDGNLNLSHICVGPDGSEEPSSTPSDEASEEPSSTPSDEPARSQLHAERRSQREPSSTPSDEASEEPSSTPSDEASEEPSSTPSDEASEEPSSTPSDEPTGETEAETGTPSVTLPPTDAIGGDSTGSTGSASPSPCSAWPG